MDSISTRCMASCSTQFYRSSLSLAKIPSNYLPMLNGKKDVMTRGFTKSMEKRARFDSERMKEETNLKKSVDAVLESARDKNLLPLKSKFTKAYNRLKENVECFHKITKKYDTVISAFSANPSAMNDPRLSQILFFDRTVNSLFNKNDTAKNMLLNIKNQTEKFQKVERLATQFKNILSIYTENASDGELSQDIDQYTNFTYYYDLYRSGNITKFEWANNHTATAFDLDSQYMARVSGPSLNYLMTMQTLVEKANNEIAPELEFQLNDMDAEAWLVFSYLMAGYFGVYSNCDQIQFGAIRSYYSDVVTLFAGNGTLRDNPPYTCSLELNTNYAMMLRSLLTCTYDQLNQGLANVVAEIGQVSTNFSTVFKNLNSHLMEYKSYWNWDISFYNDNILGVAIYFADLSTEVTIQTKAYDIWSLFCDVGGSLGLFLGASFLTFFELVDAVIFEWLARKTLKKMGCPERSEVSVVDVDDFAKGSSFLAQNLATRETSVMRLLDDESLRRWLISTNGRNENRNARRASLLILQSQWRKTTNENEDHKISSNGHALEKSQINGKEIKARHPFSLC